MSVLELGIIVAILGILAAIGWYSTQSTLDRYRMMKTARTLQMDIQNLRALAINTGRQTRLKLLESDSALDPYDVQVGAWLLQAGNHSSRSNEWDTLPIDLHGENDLSEGERSLDVGGNDEAPHISLAPWNTLVGPGLNNEDSIVFSPRGWLDNPPTDFVNGYIVLTVVSKRSNESVTLRVSRGGLARMETGSHSALPSNAVGTAEASSQ